ncbi:hypothetical protein ABZT45_39200 [Streptomyces sp. NPDC005356]|uniref:hypothetical protein n=1 Tax=Streptomyces sp. NPDC005356 TaxID=3157167 RepID=UPI0033B1C939
MSEERVDVSARRLLREKFRLGLFENRHVDPDHASQLCGSRPLRAADRAAQSDYTVLVKNDVQSLDHVDRAVEEATPFFREHLAARGTPSGHRRAPLHRSDRPPAARGAGRHRRGLQGVHADRRTRRPGAAGARLPSCPLTQTNPP